MALRGVAAPDIEWEWSEGFDLVGSGPRVCHGLREIEAASREWLAARDSYWMTADEFVEAGDKVVVPMRLHARAGGADPVIEARLGAVWTFSDGRAVAVRYYEDPDRAFAAAGVRR